jgi:deoxyribodipyrimidine photo-lyase
MGDKNVIGLYIISGSEWSSHDDAPVKIDFWMRNLSSLKAALEELSIPLVVKTAHTKKDVVDIVETVVKDMDISHVFWNTEYLVDEMKRDGLVKSTLVKLPGVYCMLKSARISVLCPQMDIKNKVATDSIVPLRSPVLLTKCAISDTI